MFQRGCDVVMQHSIREGFGLVVLAAFWKEKPVVEVIAGGIPMQYSEEYHQYLVRDDEKECADKTLSLLRYPGERGPFGRAAREHMRKNFMIPRLERDE